ncbi:hypothetical protein [Nitrosophilus kaiyonis]|uniref:hypothetical protein n=1 Tax=Nitrosophilus kaiyonis TaxID=2930200 RepID=UPI0024915579|nr:hypothetical protein [Nitrosophilus kaiyonis]
MKINIDEKVIAGEIEIGDDKFEYKAYPPSLEISIMFMEAQDEEDTKKLLKAMDKYYEECIEFDGIFGKKTKEKVRKILERSGKLIDFVNEVINEVGKQNEPKD